MIDLYFWTTPNGYKPLIFLEEAGLAYRLVPVNISAGDQFKPEFLAISPNNRMPAMVDHAPADGGEPLSLFESGAILWYLAEKSGRFVPGDLRGRKTTLEWLMWQMGGLGPMLGQNHHFAHYAPEKLPYAIERYVKETQRLYGVLERRLEGRDFIADDYTVADMAAHAGISPSTVERLFRSTFGISPLKYLKKVRLHCACKMLRTTKKTLSSIARECGFTDPTGMSRNFRTELKINPRSYRNSFGRRKPRG